MNTQIASASEQLTSVDESIDEYVVNIKCIVENNSMASSHTRSSSANLAIYIMHSTA